MVLIAECATIQQVRLRKLQLILFRLVGVAVKEGKTQAPVFLF